MLKFEVFDKDLQAAVKDAQEKVSDLRVPFTLITQSWFKSNRAIFSLTGPGKYVDLTEKYKVVKERKWKFVYPILKASGRLSESITKPGHPDSVRYIFNKLTLVLGSKVPYGGAHQTGTNRLPARPWILMGGEQTAPDEINNRKFAWIKMISDYVNDVTQKSFGK